MKKGILISTGFISILAVSLSVANGLFVKSVHADTTGTTSSSTITVVGHSEQKVQPDIALIDAGVMSSGHDAASAQDANKSTINRLVQALTKSGVSSHDIQTMWYSIQPNYGPPDKTGQPQMNGFQAITSFQVVVQNLSNVGNLVDILVKSGANQISNVQYQISNPQTVEEKAYNAALVDAKTQATNIAEALGVNITGVQSVDTTNQNYPGPIFQQAKGGASQGAGLDPGAQNVETNVRVVYTIGESNAKS